MANLMTEFCCRQFLCKPNSPVGLGCLRNNRLRSSSSSMLLYPQSFRRSGRFVRLRCVSSSCVAALNKMTSPVVSSSGGGLDSSSPWLMLPPEVDSATGEKLDCFYSPLDKQVVKLNRKKSLGIPNDDAECVSSTCGWLAFIDPTDCSLYLSNPFSLRVIQLPPIETLPGVFETIRNPKEPDVIEGFVLECHKKNYLGVVLGAWRKLFSPRSISKCFVTDLTMTSSNEKDDDCLVILNYGFFYDIAFCRPGDTAWSELKDRMVPVGVWPSRNQMAYSSKDKTLYCKFREFAIEGLHDVSNPDSEWELVIPDMYEDFSVLKGYYRPQYLVMDESSGDLLLVHRNMGRWLTGGYLVENEKPTHNEWLADKTYKFDVYKVNCEKQKLEWVNCLDDRVIFLGLNHCFCLSSNDFPGLTSNSIYFTDDVPRDSYPGHIDMGFFIMEGRRMRTFFHDHMETVARLRWVAPCNISNQHPSAYLLP